MSICKMCIALSKVNTKDKKAIISALNDVNITKVDIAKVMTNNGYAISEASIRRHLKHQENNVNS